MIRKLVAALAVATVVITILLAMTAPAQATCRTPIGRYAFIDC
jgi:hypothetical protein